MEFFFFFQAEDGIRDGHVTGVQTCALPISKIVARLRAAMGTRRISIRTVAVGSDAEKGLLETISREFNGGAHSISPSDDVAARADEIARTLGRSAIGDLKAEFEGAITDAAPGKLGSLHF